jgi:hypothetical protein
MAIKTKVDTLDGMAPLDPKTVFKQSADGKFELDIESVDGRVLEDVVGLKATISSANALANTLKGQLKAYADAGVTDPNAAKVALEKVKEMSSWTPEQKVKEQIESIQRQLEEKRVAEVGAAKSESDGLRKNLHEILCISAATSAIAAAKPKGDPSVLLPMVTGKMRIETNSAGKPVARMLGDDGNVLLTRKAGSQAEMEVDEYVQILKTTPKIAPYFEGSGTSGGGTGTPAGGSGGGGGGGPVRIKRSDRAAISRNADAIAKGTVVVVDDGA